MYITEKDLELDLISECTCVANQISSISDHIRSIARGANNLGIKMDADKLDALALLENKIQVMFLEETNAIFSYAHRQRESIPMAASQ